jgi:hypothetical protein
MPLCPNCHWEYDHNLWTWQTSRNGVIYKLIERKSLLYPYEIYHTCPIIPQ